MQKLLTDSVVLDDRLAKNYIFNKIVQKKINQVQIKEFIVFLESMRAAD